MALLLPTHDPHSVVDYHIDWAIALNGDTILYSAWTIEELDGDNYGLILSNSTNTNTTTSIYVSGGIAGKTGMLLNRVTTAGGRTLDQTCLLPIAGT